MSDTLITGNFEEKTVVCFAHTAYSCTLIHSSAACKNGVDPQPRYAPFSFPFRLAFTCVYAGKSKKVCAVAAEECRAATALTEAGVREADDRALALTRRFLRSCAVLGEDLPALVEAVSCAAQEAACDCRCGKVDLEKAWEAAAEETRVRAAQLAAYATLLEDEPVESEESETIVASARALRG